MCSVLLKETHVYSERNIPITKMVYFLLLCEVVFGSLRENVGTKI